MSAAARKFAGHPVPSKEGLKNILHRDFKIVESMAPNAAEAFIESIKAADLVTPDNVILASDGSGAPKDEKQKAPSAAPTAKAPAVEHEGMQPVFVPADFVIYKCKISKGRVIDVPLPRDFTQADRARLNAFLETQVDDDPPPAPPASPAPTPPMVRKDW